MLTSRIPFNPEEVEFIALTSLLSDKALGKDESFLSGSSTKICGNISKCYRIFTVEHQGDKRLTTVSVLMASSLFFNSIALSGTVDFDGVVIEEDKSSVTSSVFEAYLSNSGI